MTDDRSLRGIVGEDEVVAKIFFFFFFFFGFNERCKEFEEERIM